MAGGVGITPLRALLEALPGRPGDLALVYRARRPEDVVFRAELDAIARARGATLHYLVGRRGEPGGRAGSRSGPAALAALVPDVPERDVFLCGPLSLMDARATPLRRLGVPASQIHLERFSY